MKKPRPKNPHPIDGHPSYHDHILAGIKPKDEREMLREARERAKTTYGFTDDELDRWYGPHSRGK